MSSTNDATLDGVIYMHTQRAMPYHPATVSFKIGPDRRGREVYARATHKDESGICYLCFHYLDDDSRVVGSDVHFGVFGAYGRRDMPSQPIGVDCDGNLFQYHYLNTYRPTVICDFVTHQILARIDFKSMEYIPATKKYYQPLGAVITPHELVFKSKWDDPVLNPSPGKIEEDYNRGIINVDIPAGWGR